MNEPTLLMFSRDFKIGLQCQLDMIATYICQFYETRRAQNGSDLNNFLSVSFVNVCNHLRNEMNEQSQMSKVNRPVLAPSRGAISED